MEEKISFAVLVDCLEGNSERFKVLKADDGARFLVTRYGGRVFGPFLDTDAESALWTSSLLGRKEDFAGLLAKRGWNIGGDRVWIAPELQYNVRDSARFHQTYDLPGPIDPGNYDLDQVSESSCSLSQDMVLRPYSTTGREKHLRLDKRIALAADPLAALSTARRLRDSVRYAGYVHAVTLEDQRVDDLPSQTWNITQVPPGGVVIIPTTGSPEYADHWKPADRAHLKIEDRCMKLRILSDCMIKVGVKAACHFGRSGYYRQTSGGQAVLLVKQFFNDPSESYYAENPHAPGIRGYSFEVYHDDGGLGGFGELESYGRPVGAQAGRDRSTDEFVNWFYFGEEAAVKDVARILLGADF